MVRLSFYGSLSHRHQLKRSGSDSGRIAAATGALKRHARYLEEESGRLVLTPMTERRLDEIMGFLKPAPGEPSMFEESFAERERERKREKR